MPLDRKAALDRLAQFDLTSLFTQELGWEWFKNTENIDVNGKSFILTAIAEKRGVQIFHCSPDAAGRIPSADIRAAIDREITKRGYEHLLIFTDASKTEQLWLYPRREKGKPTRLIPYRFDPRTSNELLLQKLESITFTLGEEEELNLLGVAKRLRDSLDRDKLTKSFYQQFTKVRDSFQKFISGIPDRDLESWYVAVLINRLMFIYFLQEKGFLDGKQRYLQDRLNGFKGNYYREFLCPLFFQGFAVPENDPSDPQRKILGRIPYLNGGIFQKHQIEESHGRTIEIPNEAFAVLFAFFDKWHWHLDERPLAAGNEINPDVLGYVYEKYINQKQMGAYYTKEDITEYIAKNTVLPYLFDAARAKCKVAFENPNGPTIWDLLKSNPDRYFYSTVRHGVDLPLPDDIAVGVKPPSLFRPVGDGPVQTLELRKNWNRPAPSEYALPTEIWREVVARRARYDEIRAKLASGEIGNVNDLVTFNLDIRQFAQDVIENCEGPDLLRAIWHAIEKVTILDPTCGSGAFLFAALNILEPLYEACLDRMEAFLHDESKKVEAASRRISERGNPVLPRKKYEDFTKTLDRVAAHANRRYFIFKNIILKNLFGVDIMEEAIEICKLRLFLKLAAQVEPDPSKKNMGVEPLPDIDFNVRVGNTLVGYATYDEVKRAVTSRLDFDNAMERISIKAADLQQTFDAFRVRQTEGDGSVPSADKLEIQNRLNALEDELNRYLASEYGINPTKKDAHARWLKSHQPFHWCIHFYGILVSGGFDVIIGNPPFVEYSKVQSAYKIRDYTTETCGNLYAYVFERVTKLAGSLCRSGLIIPMSGMSSRRTQELRALLAQSGSVFHVSSYAGDAHPSILFEGVRLRLSIVICAHTPAPRPVALYTTVFQRWYSAERDRLFRHITLWPSHIMPMWNIFARLGGSNASAICGKLIERAQKERLYSNLGSGASVFYQEAAQYFVKASTRLPYFVKNGEVGIPPHGRFVNCTEAQAPILTALLSSTLFYLWYHAASDCYHVSDAVVQAFPCPQSVFSDSRLGCLGKRLENYLHKQSKVVEISSSIGDTISYAAFNCQASKPVLDDIDTVLARHYGFSEEELDFIINYDVKYRMGRDMDSEDE